MKLALIVVGGVLLFGALRWPMEHALFRERARAHLRSTPSLDLAVQEQIGQLGFVAALGGFRAVVADFLFIEAHVAWEKTEWSRVLLLFRQVTTLQPHVLLFWDMAAWHMGWNASAAALNNPAQPRLALRIRAQREYFALAKEFLEDGIRNNPDRPQLYEALARLYRDKYQDHARAAEYFARAADQAGAPSYARRFSAYELSYCDGREAEALAELRRLHALGRSERLPTLISRLKFLEDKLNVPLDQRIPQAER